MKIKTRLLILAVILALVFCYLILAHFIPTICIHFGGEHLEAVPATCKETGLTEGWKCTWCGAVYAGRSVTNTSNEHKYAKTIIKESTCTEEGLSYNVCTVCGYECTLNEPKAKHSYTSTILSESTCTQNGLVQSTCTVCGDILIQKKPLKDHSFGEWVISTEPTCTKKGIKSASCINCSYVKTENIDSLGHDIKSRTNACTRCDYVRKASVSLTSSEKKNQRIYNI